MFKRNSGKPDRVTIFGVFAILALLPTAFSVAYEFNASGPTQGRTWLTALPPFALLVATRFIPSVWRRSRAGRWALITVAIVASAAFMWHMTGLFGFLAAIAWMHYLAPVAFVVLYAGFGLIIGRAHSRPSYGYARRGRAPVRSAGRAETYSRR
jgi:hypothetical protein